MNTITYLKVIAYAVLAIMLWQIITTSLQSNLFLEWDYLASIPWMRATLYDFYANVLFIYLWIVYKENSVLKKIIWLVLLVTLGSVATCIYILKELYQLDRGEGVKELLIKQRN